VFLIVAVSVGYVMMARQELVISCWSFAYKYLLCILVVVVIIMAPSQATLHHSSHVLLLYPPLLPSYIPPFSPLTSPPSPLLYYPLLPQCPGLHLWSFSHHCQCESSRPVRSSPVRFSTALSIYPLSCSKSLFVQ
jgi:hypothetical protein